LTSILAIPIAPLWVFSDSGAYALTWFPLSKCYLISLLANLNARSRRPIVLSAFATDNVPGTYLCFDHDNNQERSEMNADLHHDGGIVSFIRFTVRTIRRGLTASHNGRASRMDQEAKWAIRDGGTSPSVAARNGGGES